MALLQIAEPGESTAPHQHRLAVGIDLGTTHSLVATVRSGEPVVLPDAQGRRLLPSVVRYDAKGMLSMGHEALASQAQDPLNTLSSMKRLMGRGYADALTAGVPYPLVSSESGMVQVQTIAGPISPVEVAAELLMRLRFQAEDSLGGPLVGAVITVPAYFDDAQRQATKDAAQLAGLTVLRLINEPTAAALAYGLETGAEGLYAIYDLGGGTFDLSLLRLSKGVFEVVATGGDTALGGDDLDEAIALHALRSWSLTREGLSASAWRELLQASRALKEQLSDVPSASLSWSAQEAGSVHQLSLSQSELASLVAPHLSRTFVVCDQALADARVGVKDLQGVVLVGGTTRMPAVRAAVASYFGQTPKTEIDPDAVVAIGAALQANLLAGNRAAEEDWLLLDVIPLSLGLETMGGLVEKVIPRNTPIPAARAQEFTTFKDGQTAMAVHVLQGERELVSDCRSLARFELRGIPPMAAGAARIRVTFQVDADGLLDVSAQELSSGVQASVLVKPSYGLSDGQIAEMLQSAYQGAEQDAQLRMLREAQVDGLRLIESLEAALSVDGDLLDAPARAELQDRITQLRGLLAQVEAAQQDHARLTQEIREQTEALSHASDPFAALRMDRAIAQALKGQSIREL